MRTHGTLKERPYLTPLAARPTGPLAAPPEPIASTTREATQPKIVDLEQGLLAEYTKIADGVS